MYNFKPYTRGEPIDVTALATMSSYIAEINAKLLSERSSQSSIHLTETDTRKSLDTSNLAIWTGKVFIIGGTVPKADAERVNWHADFDVMFKYPPIVTATPYCDTSGGGTIAPSTIWIHSVTKSGVKGKWKWLGTTTKVETVYAHVIAIGEGIVV